MTAPLVSLAVSAAAGVAKGIAAAFGEASTPDARAATKAKTVARDFEAMFVEQMLDRMVSSIGEEGPLGDNGTGGAVYRSMLVKEYSGEIAKSGGIGLSDQVYREMLRLQEENGHAPRA